MNHRNHLFTVLNNVDDYSALACLGSAQFIVTSEAIRQAVRLIPDDPTPDTIEAFLNEERNLKVDVKFANNDDCAVRAPLTGKEDVVDAPATHYEQRRTLSALLDLRRDLADQIEEHAALISGDGRDRTLTDTMEFMRDSMYKIDPQQFARQYRTNMRLGQRNYGQTIQQYVESETQRALRDKERFAAKCEYAVQFLEGLDLIEGPVADRIWESIHRRCVAKLLERRITVGRNLSWRTDPDVRANIESDLAMIEDAIVQFGGEVPPDAVLAPADLVEEPVVLKQPEPVPQAQAQQAVTMEMMMQMMQLMLQSQKPAVAGESRTKSYRVPGEVTITKQ